MQLRRTLALGVTSLALLATGTVGVSAQGTTIRIGSDNFYESKLVGEIYAQVLEANGWTVDRQLGLGSRAERNPVFQGGQVDLVPEYVGSGLGYYTLAEGASEELAALTVTGDGAMHLPHAGCGDRRLLPVEEDLLRHGTQLVAHHTFRCRRRHRGCIRLQGGERRLRVGW